MKRALLLLLAFSLAILPAFAACSGSISQYVPAVVGEGGGLVNVSMELVPGHGDVFITASPRTGVSTQESAEEAVAYARSSSGQGNGCDVLVSFGSNPSTDYIEGPSAGTAMAAMAFALLENRTMRNDTIITGTIEPGGEVGPVGGLYEKAKGASSIGASYFITPAESLYEMLLLRNVESQYGIHVLQARRVEDVIGFMIFNRTIAQGGLEVENREIPDAPPYDSSGISAFVPVVDRMIELEKGVSSTLPAEDNESALIRSFFENEISRQQAMLSKGYLFSAANEAFLDYIDSSTIRVILDGDADLPRKKGEAGICLSGIKSPAMTDVNFEWVAGADLRQAWAQDKIDSTPTDGNLLEDEKFVSYNELMYAQAWCEVAKGLVNASPQGGREIDESAWKPVAEEKLSQARALDIQDEDVAHRLEIAGNSFDDGRYGAATYDAVYVIATEEAAADGMTGASENESLLAQMLGESRTSLWGKIYQSHAAFLYTQNETAGAFQTALFASSLDDATAEMRASLEYSQNASGSPGPQVPGEEGNESGGQGGTGEAPEEGTLMILGFAAAISIFLFLILLLLLTRRKNGGNNGKGPRAADRAKQKKG